ncbi:MAG: ABC transporter ATP-binding protein [Acidobacteria bacterium]|nr:ABC transporter ATP-binding protein [Acidobacteriota bacterium]
MNEFLHAENLRKSFLSGGERLDVLVDLSLTLGQGEMVAITGVSGSGKSTLLHILGGMDRPDSGSITIAGRDLLALGAEELSEFRNRELGFVFQFHHLLPEFTALENVMMPLLLRGVRPEQARDEALSALDGVGVAPRARHRPGELSGGEQQRVAIARALVARPSLLLADEPTGNLDPHTGETIGVLLHELHARCGLTSILVTHNQRLAQVCTRIYRLEDGRLA